MVIGEVPGQIFALLEEILGFKDAVEKRPFFKGRSDLSWSARTFFCFIPLGDS